MNMTTQQKDFLLNIIDCDGSVDAYVQEHDETLGSLGRMLVRLQALGKIKINIEVTDEAEEELFAPAPDSVEGRTLGANKVDEIFSTVSELFSAFEVDLSEFMFGAGDKVDFTDDNGENLCHPEDQARWYLLQCAMGNTAKGVWDGLKSNIANTPREEIFEMLFDEHVFGYARAAKVLPCVRDWKEKFYDADGDLFEQEAVLVEITNFLRDTGATLKLPA